MEEYLKTAEEVLSGQYSAWEGLSVEEAEKRQQTYGKNKLKEGKKESILQRFLKQLIDPMTIILLIAACVSAITAWYAGESFTDVIIILIVVLINAVLGVL